MQKKFVQVLVVALAAFAVLAFAYPDDDLSDDDFGGVMLQESSVKIATHRDQQSVAADSPASHFVWNKRTPIPSSSGKTPSSTLLSIAACVLRC
jgi:hypothetical protein